MRKNGFSLIEVLIFVTILSLFFVAASAVTSAIIRNMQISQHKLVASHYIDELNDWLYYQKTSSWIDFSAKTGTYCFNELNWGNNNACNSELISNTIFKREAVFTSPTDNVINATITITWPETGNVTYSINQQKQFSLNE